MNDPLKKSPDQEKPPLPHMVPHHRGYWMLGLLGVVTVALGGLMFSNYVRSAKFITESLHARSLQAPGMTVKQCATANIEWASTCQAMGTMCDNTVPRMMKICLVAATDTEQQCAVYGDTIYGYNFGAQECAPYMVKKNRLLKKACGDTWQQVADYCQAVAKAHKAIP